ncbi:DUF721 domain-containing protein [bacterium]|nr:MAG: DUF721 domain-containing protein [bacterium]
MWSKARGSLAYDDSDDAVPGSQVPEGGVMERLFTALQRWQPPAEASLEHAVASHWERIVGPGVAANARPRELRDGALTVLVPSAAWRHELSFHAPSIVAALRAVPEIGNRVERLRLRLGRARMIRVGRAQAFTPQRRPSAPLGDPRRDPALDTATAFERLRQRFARIAREERRHGREACPDCGAFLARGERCISCSRRRDEATVRATQRYLFESPWIGYDGTAALVPGLDFALYAHVRARTLERWWKMLERARYRGAVSRDGRERKVAQSYVALKSGLTPERLTPVITRDILGDQIYDLLWGVHDAR